MAFRAFAIISLVVGLAHAQVCEKKCQGDTGANNRTFRCENSGCTSIPVYDDTACDVTDVCAGEFTQRIFLKGNRITTVTPIEYQYLKHLDLSRNNISVISNSAFQGCGSLESLDLTGNNIVDLNDKVFTGLSNLKNLYLGNNKLAYVESSLFLQHCPQLEVLDLRENMIEEVDHNALNDLTQLFSLELGGNKITELHYLIFRRLKNLKFLRLQHNQISFMNASTFEDLEKLTLLDLRGNQISNLESHVFDGLVKLQILHLGSNKLTSVASGLSDLGSVHEIYLNDNPIVEITPASFPQTTREIFMENMPKLRIVRNYAFTALGTSSVLPHLRKVYVQGCPLLATVESEAFGDMATRLNATMALQVLVLRHNHLKTLHSGLVQWEQLETLDLSGNPWTCDCHLDWVHTATLPHGATTNMTCQEPYSLRDHAVTSVDSFSCSRRNPLGVALILAASAAFVLIAGCLCYKYKYRVFPCCFESPGRYKMMFKNENMEDPTFSPVELKRSDSETLDLHEPTQV